MKNFSEPPYDMGQIACGINVAIKLSQNESLGRLAQIFPVVLISHCTPCSKIRSSLRRSFASLRFRKKRIIFFMVTVF